MEKMDKDRFFDIIKSDEVIISANISTTPGNLPKSRHAHQCVVDATAYISTAAELFVVANFYQLEDIMLKLKHLTSDHGHYYIAELMSMSLSHNKTVTKPYVLILCHFIIIKHLIIYLLSFYDAYTFGSFHNYYYTIGSFHRSNRVYRRGKAPSTADH